MNTMLVYILANTDILVHRTVINTEIPTLKQAWNGIPLPEETES